MKHLVFLIGLLTALSSSAAEEIAPKILASDGGRFVYGQVGAARADQYMLDTKTGKLWQLVQAQRMNSDGATNTTVMMLKPIPYQDGRSGESPTPPQTLDEGFGEYLKTKPKK